MKFKKTIANIQNKNIFKKITQSVRYPTVKLKNFVNKNEKSKKLFKDIKNIILIVFSVFLFLIIWVNRIKLHPENMLLLIKDKICSMSAGKGFPCEIEGEKISNENFDVFNDNIVALSDNSLNLINKSGNIFRNEKHNFSNPCLKHNGIRSIIYDRGGKNFKIESLSQNLYSGKCEKNIIACATSDSGVYAIAHRSVSHLGEIAVYNKKGKEKYRFSFSEYYISDISLNSSGNEAAVCGLATNNGNINSCVYILDFKSDKPKRKFNLENNIVTRIEYISNGNVLAIGDKYMSFINLKSGNVKNYSYENKILKFYDFNKNEGICCCFATSVNEFANDEIVMINNDGKELFKTKTSESFYGISHRNSKTVALTSNKIMVYNFAGTFEGYVDVKNQIKKIILLPNSHAYILRAGKIDKIKLSPLQKPLSQH